MLLIQLLCLKPKLGLTWRFPSISLHRLMMAPIPAILNCEMQMARSCDESAIDANTGNCTYTENPDYVKTLIDLINQARADVGRAALTVNSQLTTAARAHSLDMACNNFMKHSGSDGSWTGDRLTKAGYSNPYYLELLAIGLPQDAMNQWRTDRDKNQWDSVVNSRVTEIGVGYVFSKFSAYGGYWTVVMGGL